ncbi:protealysin inhibitor emfourin [Methylomagnum sp.]
MPSLPARRAVFFDFDFLRYGAFEHLPIYKQAMDVAVYFERAVAGFSRYHKYTLGTELRNHSREIVGLVVRATRRRTRLAPDEARELEHLVAASRLPTSGEFFSESGRDLRQYELTIEGPDSKIALAFDDQNIPESAKPLVGFLRQHCGPRALK